MANTNAGRKFYVCATAQQTDLDLSGYEAVTWVEVSNVGNIGETGVITNMLTYDTMDTDVTQKSKGVSNAGDPEIEVARVAADAGQIIMRANAATALNYAFKVVDEDGTTYYMRGVVGGPKRTNGGVEDFITETYMLGLNQLEIVDEA